ncbi:MAG: hypothetical protein KDA61_21275 [Planctomycetales bacterium]|nr:hypothetical protein [Planctomycetales bacterium]
MGRDILRRIESLESGDQSDEERRRLQRLHEFCESVRDNEALVEELYADAIAETLAPVGGRPILPSGSAATSVIKAQV